VAVPSVVDPSAKVTVPVGVPAPGATAATVAVTVTDWPYAVGLADEESAVVVAPRTSQLNVVFPVLNPSVAPTVTG
jgi:hypothetical protein